MRIIKNSALSSALSIRYLKRCPRCLCGIRMPTKQFRPKTPSALPAPFASTMSRWSTICLRGDATVCLLPQGRVLRRTANMLKKSARSGLNCSVPGLMASGTNYFPAKKAFTPSARACARTSSIFEDVTLWRFPSSISTVGIVLYEICTRSISNVPSL